LAYGASNSLISKVDPANVGSLFGVNQFFYSLGGALGPVVILAIYQQNSQ